MNPEIEINKIEHFRDCLTIDIDELGMLGWNECSFADDYNVPKVTRSIQLAEEDVRKCRREWRY